MLFGQHRRPACPLWLAAAEPTEPVTVRAVRLRDIMTSGVVTAGVEDDVLYVAQLMRDHSVGSVILCDPQGDPVAMVTDRDLAVRVMAEGRPLSEPVGSHSSRPLVSGEPDMDLEEAAARMVQHRIRRLPVVGPEGLVGIVTLDDIAVRTGNLEVAQRMTHDVIEGAFPEFFFHERG
jgi:CBS domain-containing protein